MDFKNDVEEIRIRQWADIIHNARNSGTTIKQFCKDSGFSLRVYYYHLKQVREYYLKHSDQLPDEFNNRREKRANEEKRFVELLSPDVIDNTSKEIIAVDNWSPKSEQSDDPISHERLSPANDHLTVRYHDYMIDIGQNFSEEALKRLLRVLADA